MSDTKIPLYDERKNLLAQINIAVWLCHYAVAANLPLSVAVVGQDILPMLKTLQARLGPLVFGDDWKGEQK